MTRQVSIWSAGICIAFLLCMWFWLFILNAPDPGPDYATGPLPAEATTTAKTTANITGMFTTLNGLQSFEVSEGPDALPAYMVWSETDAEGRMLVREADVSEVFQGAKPKDACGMSQIVTIAFNNIAATGKRVNGLPVWSAEKVRVMQRGDVYDQCPGDDGATITSQRT